VLDVRAEWYDGTIVQRSLNITVIDDWPPDDAPADIGNYPSLQGAITVAGGSWYSCCVNTLTLHAPATRGARAVVVAARRALVAEHWAPGRYVMIDGDTGTQWSTATNKNPVPKVQIVELAAAPRAPSVDEAAAAPPPPDGATLYVLTLAEPLRHDFRLGAWDSASVSPNFWPRRRVGIEHLHVQQVFNDYSPVAADSPYDYQLYMRGVRFQRCVDCWMHAVRVNGTGESPIWNQYTKHNSFTDCVFSHTFYPYRGSTGYALFGGAAQDVLTDNCTFHELRHVDMQSSTAGSVMRRAHMRLADPQSHQGFSIENLWELNFFDTRQGGIWYDHLVDYSASSGTYWQGMFCEHGSDFGTVGHTPACGPRWVFWGNEAIGSRSGIHLGGQNEAHVVAYNKIVSAGYAQYGGHPMVVWDQSFGHSVFGNAFVARSETHGKHAVFFDKESQNCGIEFFDNTFYSNSNSAQEPITRTQSRVQTNVATAFTNLPTAFSAVHNNAVADYDGHAPLPQPPHHPSLFAMQRGLPGAIIVSPSSDIGAHHVRGYPLQLVVDLYVVGSDTTVARVDVLVDGVVMHKVDAPTLDLRETVEASKRVSNAAITKKATMVIDGVWLESEEQEQQRAAVTSSTTSGSANTEVVLSVVVVDSNGGSEAVAWPRRLRIHNTALLIAPLLGTPEWAFHLGAWWSATESRSIVRMDGSDDVVAWMDIARPNDDRAAHLDAIDVDDGTSRIYPKYQISSPLLRGRAALTFAAGDVTDRVDRRYAFTRGDYLYTINDRQPRTVVVVAAYSASNADKRNEIFSSYSGSSRSISIGHGDSSVRAYLAGQILSSSADVAPPGEPIIVALSCDYQSTRLYVNTANTVAASATAAELVPPYFDQVTLGGSRTTLDLDGAIGDVFVFRNSLPISQLDALMTALREHYSAAPPDVPQPPPRPPQPTSTIDATTTTGTTSTTARPISPSAPTPTVTRQPPSLQESPIDAQLLPIIIGSAVGGCCCLIVVVVVVLMLVAIAARGRNRRRRNTNAMYGMTRHSHRSSRAEMPSRRARSSSGAPSTETGSRRVRRSRPSSSTYAPINVSPPAASAGAPPTVTYSVLPPSTAPPYTVVPPEGDVQAELAR